MAANNHPGARALLEKFHAGTCTPEELAILESWYEELGEDLGQVLSPEQTAQYQQQFLANFRQQIARKKTIRLHNRHFRWIAAASLLLLAGITYFWIRPDGTSVKELAESKALHIKNGTAGVKQVLLQDSSLVWLNSGASLSWEEGDNGRLRQVSLSGEGYFDVHRDDQRPFIITTRDLTIQVLGTVFNVEAYPGEQSTRVSLVQGSVRVNAVGDKTIQTLLKPGDIASFAEGNKEIIVGRSFADMPGNWKDGGFSVTDISLRDAVLRLCERNGYSLQWENDKDVHKKISVAFTKEDFEQVLGNICYMSHKKYKITGRQVTIY